MTDDGASSARVGRSGIGRVSVVKNQGQALWLLARPYESTSPVEVVRAVAEIGGAVVLDGQSSR